MELEEERQLTELRPGSESGPIVAATVGRAMTTLLNAKPKKLHDAVSRLDSPPNFAPITVSVEQSLWFLHKYIGEAAEKGDHLDHVLVPILQHSLTMRESKRGNQAMILLNWLFQDEIFLEAILRNVSNIISRRDDRYVALGWCVLGRSLIECENVVSDVTTNAIREKLDVILKTLSSSVPHLLSIICNGSIMQEGFELPTRLAVAAADFVLSLTVALTRKDPPLNNITKKQKSSFVSSKNQPSKLLHAATSDRDENEPRETSELSSTLDLKLLLWNNLNELITLVKKLTDWSRKSRCLHAEGLKRVCKWLQELKQQYDCFLDQLHMVKTGSLLLSSCWKHYGMLMCLEDRKFSQQHKELLNQYLSGIQFYADNQAEEPTMGKSSKSETINFFLNCLMLVLGRLDSEQFEDAVTESGSQISQVLMSQLQYADEDIIDGAINIFKAVILKTNHTLSRRSLDDIRQIDAILPMLLNLLDERDAAAKAIVKLLAEFCSICSNTKCLDEVLKRIYSKNVAQRRNAVDVVADLIQITSGSIDTLSQAEWQDVANHLLECLGDEDEAIQNQSSNLIPLIDPHMVLPGLVDLSYSSHENIQTSASTALVALLVNHKEEPEILCMLLDCLSKLSQTPDSGAAAVSGRKAGSTPDADGLLKLLPEWAKHVEDWHVIVGPLVDKMLAEPSNAVIVRFLSHISEYLADAVDLVFNRLILCMREQKDVNECFSKCQGKTDSNNEALKHEDLFNRLCPLLVIRLLPLRVFDDLNSPLVYGKLLETRHFSMEDSGCIAALMINRALSRSEFEDVRKLAAELCGRLHPEVLIPILTSQLESAANTKDLIKIKVCLFSLCTCLMVRGDIAYKHPDLLRIRKTIEIVLSWAPADGDETSKAQHGCIDSLALMLCAELQAPESSKGSDSVLAYVVNQLSEDGRADATACLSFRLCMANVLISACQKIPDSGKKSYAKKITPHVIRSIRGMKDPEMKAACIQVLFTVAYHLKSLIFPHSNDLLNVALNSLRQGSHKEKMAGAKLVMCLMASEEEVVESISGGLMEATTLLRNLSSTDPSAEVRQMCQQLLLCLTSH